VVSMLGHLFADEFVFSDVPKPVANWIYYGRDLYAANSWNNLPGNRSCWVVG
jgi:sucrose-6-phosphate hydrolase SacC (GH32 family)